MGILSRVPCAVKKVLVSYLFYIKWCVYGAALVAQLVKNLPAMQETLVQFLDRKDPQRRDRLPTPGFLGFPGGSDGKESTCSVEDLGSIPELGRPTGGGHGNPLQYSCLRIPMD